MAKKKTKKTRVAVPTTTKTTVLKEFNHRCAICGTDNPQIHHLDEDPSNNDPQNLLPLCPNCHLLDQHNPTARIDTRKLQLFRQYKDPVILSPKFEPLFRRMLFLEQLEELSLREQLERKHSLINFVSCLEMGAFYSGELELRFRLEREQEDDVFGHSPEDRKRLEEVGLKTAHRFERRLREVRDEVFELCVEMLRYQPWESPSAR